MTGLIHFNAQQVAAREYEQLNPNRFDFRWNHDYTEVTAIPLTWWDDASYRDYQGDPEEGFEALRQAQEADAVAQDSAHISLEQFLRADLGKL